MLRCRLALSLLSLAALAGCATTPKSQASAAEPRTAPAEEQKPPPAPARKKPAAVASVKPPPKASEPVRPPAPPPPVTDAQAEFACGPGGTLARRAPTERPLGVVAFEPGMTRPEKLSGPPPLYTREALEQGVQGQMIARCILTREGSVRSCRILKPLPPLDEAVLSSLCGSRYTPVLKQGQPVDAEYTFNVRLTLP